MYFSFYFLMRRSDPFQTYFVSVVPEILNAQQAFKDICYPLKQGEQTLLFSVAVRLGLQEAILILYS